MSTPKTKQGKETYLSPLIDKLLSVPLTFKAAQYPDTVNIKPSSYVTFNTSTPIHQEKEAQIDNPRENKGSMTRPKSVAEAVAQYTGRKFLSKRERKDVKRDAKRKKEEQKKVIESKEEEEDDDSESDEDFQTADEDTEESEDEENNGNLSGDSEEEEEEEEEDTDRLKSDLKKDIYADSDSDDENEEIEGKEKEEEEEEEGNYNDDAGLNDDEILKSKETPPTSPEDDLAKSISLQARIPSDQFYDLNEEDEDRGSNGCNRLYKSWREFKDRPPSVGLLNHGVTCYMNSAVQAMCHIPALMHYLVEVHYDKHTDVIKPNSVTRVLADTVCKMCQMDRKGNRKVLYINPKKLIRKLSDINCTMSEWQQEDSHEYFMSLMSRLQEESTPKGVKLNKSIIYDIFGGLLNQTVTCRNCGHISTTQQEFYDLSLGLENKRRRASNLLSVQQMSQLRKQIGANDDTGKTAKTQLSELLRQRILLAKEENKIQQEESRQSSKETTPQQQEEKQKSQSVEGNDQNSSQAADSKPSDNRQHPGHGAEPSSVYFIENSIKYFFSPEMLRTDKRDRSGYVCENCKKTTAAVKVSTIERAPETLAIHLKRFRFNGTSSMKVKAKVAYPEVLDLSEYTTSMKTPTRYKLIAVILHQGRSVSSGHYIAHCRQPDGTWATYDDEYVNRIKPAEALSDPSAYVLFYSRLTHKSVKIDKEGDADDDDDTNDADDKDNNRKRKVEADVSDSTALSQKTRRKRNRRR
ncbi:hypothetical protein FOA43_000898 [Brettanomyces nanus]|uniref:ubiquitinyl hydrolase 1 n=1 Tax=Eeniella nana TaxID=13502 RepID=A0A875RX53_EENNA|nr:uncharacterized protein FOA43_000898 [Brettanomyces nanus]QPG73586.1 hypothetical protein FOA43_000898 [Brettanomyces nanus]